MNESELILMLGEAVKQLTRIADRLEATPLPAPNIQLPLSEYPQFDWSRVGATVVGRDKDGATAVRWGGRVYTRRAPSNKYGAAIFYSRSIGKDADDNSRYEWLVAFKDIQIEADPIPDRTRQAIRNAARRTS